MVIIRRGGGGNGLLELLLVLLTHQCLKKQNIIFTIIGSGTG